MQMKTDERVCEWDVSSESFLWNQAILCTQHILTLSELSIPQLSSLLKQSQCTIDVSCFLPVSVVLAILKDFLSRTNHLFLCRSSQNGIFRCREKEGQKPPEADKTKVRHMEVKMSCGCNADKVWPPLFLE